VFFLGTEDKNFLICSISGDMAREEPRVLLAPQEFWTCKCNFSGNSTSGTGDLPFSTSGLVPSVTQHAIPISKNGDC
jgi:hypothetical protein